MLVLQVVQTELVLGIFRRLSQDVHEYGIGLDQLRKKEMSHALNDNIRDIFSIVLQNLEVREVWLMYTTVTIPSILCKLHMYVYSVKSYMYLA